MKRRIGILTSGGDCPGLNAAIRGVAKAAYELFDAEIIGFIDGYRGLIEGEYRAMERREFSGILTLGGTILGTSRQPFKLMRVVSEDNIDKVEQMKKNYDKLKLDCLVTLGGSGTHKTAQLLSSEGLNVVGLPKTIDNDIFGTDVTFGFHTAVDIATDVVDRIHTTATSHGRVMIIELMGNKAGWLTLYAGVAGGADIILLPEIPYDIAKVCQAVEKRRQQGKTFSILTVAEGALSMEEASLAKKELKAALEARTMPVSYRVAAEVHEATGAETRVVVPGHIQRGGSPSAYDRVLATKFGVFAAELIKNEQYGTTVALVGDHVAANKLADIAGKSKLVPPDHELVNVAKNIGIKFGD
jgi:ATP-dependent phosphofructokinase / diphosphate-dependent phosphofructokinase